MSIVSFSVVISSPLKRGYREYSLYFQASPNKGLPSVRVVKDLVPGPPLSTFFLSLYDLGWQECQINNSLCLTFGKNYIAITGFVIMTWLENLTWPGQKANHSWISLSSQQASFMQLTFSESHQSNQTLHSIVPLHILGIMNGLQSSTFQRPINAYFNLSISFTFTDRRNFKIRTVHAYLTQVM